MKSGKNDVVDNQNVEIIKPVIKLEDSKEENTSISKNYYYKQLDSAGKIIYKGLKDNIDNMKCGNYNIDFGTQFNDLLNSENGEEKLNKSFQSAWNAFVYDYVDVFFIDVTKLILTTRTTTIVNFSTHKVNLSSGDYENYFESNINSEEDLRKKEKYIVDIRNQFITQLQGYSEYDKIKKVHDWLVDNLKYDTEYKNSNRYNIYGALSQKQVVCEGYARTFKYILDGLGIENILVSGKATNSSGVTEAHAWNYVMIDNKWYAIDVTWDDPVISGNGKLTDKLKYKYFLKGSEEFNNNHKVDGYLSTNSIEFKFPELEKENYIKK